jgi:phosphoglycerate dehydrogenase-like enzyme
MIFGHGTIGQAVARRLEAFDMRLVIVRRQGTAPLPNNAEAIDLATARGRLGEADHIVFALPLTRETRGFLGAAEIARLKPSVHIVNIGRAAVIDEPALAAALRDGRIGGVALDVFWREPLCPDDPVWTWPRTAITPHMSANVAGGNTALIAATATETLDTILAGRTPANRVDLAAAY